MTRLLAAVLSAPRILAALAAFVAAPAQGVLPSGYIQLTSITSTGTQYIKTGMVPTADTTVEMDFNTGPYEHNTTFFGQNANVGYYQYLLFKQNNAYKFWGNGSQVSDLQNNTDAHLSITSENKLILDYGDTAVTTTVSRAASSSNDFNIFADSGGNYKGSWTLYSMQISTGGVLQRDFVPAKRMSDGACGLFDQVEGKFYENAGTGMFTMGDIVPSDDMLAVSSSLEGVGSPSPAVAATGLAAGQTVAVNCGTTPWTNAEGRKYACTGWKLYDADGNVVSNGTETSFAYTHPDPAKYRNLEWQWEFRRDSWEAGADVAVAAGDTVVVDATSPLLNSLTVKGTLVCSNWLTCVQAKSVVVKDGGTITCAGPFWDREIQRTSDSAVLPVAMSNRVWIAASESLTVEAGGRIDVNGHGYGCPYVINTYGGQSNLNGFGPGRSTDRSSAAAHGGATAASSPYGDPVRPTAPGSSGGGRTSGYMLSPGGGAIFLDCPQAVVTIRGTICADGENAHYTSGGYESGAGTGGSILIDAKRLVTAGAVITANGGNDCKAGGYGVHTGGAGGRIALHYDTAVQQAGDIDAATKVWASGDHCYLFSSSSGVWSRPGTVWMPDEALLAQFLSEGDRFCGEPVVGTGDGRATVPSIGITQGYVVIGNSLTNLTVTGDVTLSGNDVRLCFGANERQTGYTFTSPAVPFTLSVGGDMTLELGARAEFFSAPTNGFDQTRGCFVEVAGTFEVKGRVEDAAQGLDERISAVYPHCHPTNGAGVRFHAANISFDEKSNLSATTRGFIAGSNGSAGFGPGGGRGQSYGTGSSNQSVGAGHGGRGGYGPGASSAYIENHGLANDDPRRPTLAGSAGGYHNGGGTTGGGIVHLVADEFLSIAGAVTADSEDSLRGSAGAGGSILLEANKFQPASTASFSANGGGHNYDAAGGGGCISVWIGAPGCGFDEVGSMLELDPATAFGAATVSANQGAYGANAEHTHDAEPGTVTAYQVTPKGKNLIVRTLDEDAFGLSAPSYGAHAVAPGDAFTVVATDVVNADDIRSRCIGYTLETLNGDGTWSEPVAYEGATWSGTMDDKVYRITWRWTLEAKLTVVEDARGSVTCSQPPKDAGWYTLGSTATLSVAANAGWGFAFWSGDVPYVNLADNPLSLTMDAAKEVAPNYQASPDGGQSFTWTGAGGDGNWNNIANWTPNGIPLAGDHVSFPATAAADAFSVLIDRNTAALASLTVPANVTLVATNWMTKIVAETVTVKDGGTITCAGPFADRIDDVVSEIQMSNRVWIACTDLTVEEGGRIDVSRKGYGCLARTQSTNARSYGPGRAPNAQVGASHGGIGGLSSGAGSFRASAPYGSVSEPILPGSSGSKIANGNYVGRAYSGGGAIRIDATGIVTVDGTIAADGEDSESNDYRYSGAGAGGSVLITASRIRSTGVGRISACGGTRGGFGGGGRIALHYDPAATTAEDIATLTVTTAAGGRNKDTAAQPGSVWLADEKLFAGIAEGRLCGELFVADKTELQFENLTVDGNYLRFGGSVKRVTVAGDLVLTGSEPRLDFGADTFDPSITSQITVYPHGDTDGVPFVLSVGGNLLIGPGGRIDLYAAVTNGASASDFGGRVSVGGMLTVSSNAVVYSNNQFLNGAAFALEAGSVLVQTNGVISADSRGFAGGAAGCDGNGPGRGKGGANNKNGISAGHGGNGANASGAYGQAYDDLFRPALAGSGGGASNFEYPGSMGGGYIYLKANRKLTLGGTITANATTARNRAGSGSGGGILIDARKFAVEPGAVLSAKGGDNTYSSCTSGAGGIIAVWTGRAYAGEHDKRSARELDVPEGLTVDVSAGSVSGVVGEPGSAKFLELDSGFYLIVR